MMLAKFRHHYPQGSLLSELVKIDRGLFIVKVSLQVQDKILATALASADCVEAAEDKARQRAIATLVLDNEQAISNQSIIDNTASPMKSSSTSVPSLSSAQSSQPALTSESKLESISNHNLNNDLTNHNNVVDFAEHQSEMPSQRPISDQGNRSPAPTTESSQPQQRIESKINDKIQPSAGSGDSDNVNLFSEVVVSEASPTAASNDFNNNNIVGTTSHSEPHSVSNTEIGEIDFNEIKQKTDIEIKRLGWTKDDGRDFLKSRYGKRSRLHLTDDQLLEFLHYLESLPNPS